MKGKIKWYDKIKGYGFIVSETGEDIFVHRTGLKNPTLGLNEGQEVEYETREGDKGTIAVNVE
jgi:cold shock protein